MERLLQHLVPLEFLSSSFFLGSEFVALLLPCNWLHWFRRKEWGVDQLWWTRSGTLMPLMLWNNWKEADLSAEARIVGNYSIFQKRFVYGRASFHFFVWLGHSCYNLITWWVFLDGFNCHRLQNWPLEDMNQVTALQSLLFSTKCKFLPLSPSMGPLKWSSLRLQVCLPPNIYNQYGMNERHSFHALNYEAFQIPLHCMPCMMNYKPAFWYHATVLKGCTSTNRNRLYFGCMLLRRARKESMLECISLKRLWMRRCTSWSTFHLIASSFSSYAPAHTDSWRNAWCYWNIYQTAIGIWPFLHLCQNPLFTFRRSGAWAFFVQQSWTWTGLETQTQVKESCWCIWHLATNHTYEVCANKLDWAWLLGNMTSVLVQNMNRSIKSWKCWVVLWVIWMNRCRTLS